MKIIKFLQKNLEAVIVLLMTAWDGSLHWVELFGVWQHHPLYPMFPLFGIISYDIFWTSYWTFAFILIFIFIIRINRRKK